MLIFTAAFSNTSRTRLTLEDYLAARHLVVTPWNEKQGVLDLRLEELGYTRHIAIKTPSMLSAPFIVAQSDLLMAIPRKSSTPCFSFQGVTTRWRAAR